MSIPSVKFISPPFSYSSLVSVSAEKRMRICAYIEKMSFADYKIAAAPYACASAHI